MIKVIKTQNPEIKDGSFGYIRDMKMYQINRILLRILLLLSIVLIPVLLLWLVWEKVTKKEYLKGKYLVFGKFRYSLDDREIKIDELNSENGNTLLGTVAGGVLFGGIGALGGAILGSRKSGVFVLSDREGNKTLIEIKGTALVKKFRELAFTDQCFD